MSSSSHASKDVVRSSILQAINIGAPLYNQGRIRECRDLYMQMARELLSIADKGSLATALSTALSVSWSTPDENEGAWTMRRCFDGILDGSIPLSMDDEVTLDP